MKRPLVLVGFTVLLTLAAAAFFGAGAAFPAMWVCLGAFAASLAWKRTRRAAAVPLALASAAAALALFCGYDARFVEPPRSLDGKTAEIAGTVCELPEFRNGKWYYTVRVDSLPEEAVSPGFRVRLVSQSGLKAEPYSRVSGRVRFFLPPAGEGYSSGGYYASKGVMMFAVPESFSGLSSLPAEEKPPYYYALRARQELIRCTKELLPQSEAALVCGILLGDKSGLSQKLTDDFRAAGVSHLLAVSGLHMSTVAQLFLFLLLFLRVPKKPSAVLTAAGVFCFMAVTCFVPSVTRSGVMCLLCLAAPAFSRRADALNSLCCAGLLLCLQNPYSGADVGFLLSFCAALGLILCAGPVTDFLNRRLDRIRALRPLVRPLNAVAGTSLSAALFTLPVLLPAFGLLSVIAPLANLLMLVPASLLLVFGGTAAVLELLLPASYLSRPFALAAGLLAEYLENCASWLAGLPGACVSPAAGPARLWLAGTLLLFGLAFAMRGKKLLPYAACLSALLLTAGILSFQIAKRGVTRVTVLDAGDSLAVVLTQNGRAVIVGCDSSDSGQIISYLRSQNISALDCLTLLTPGRREFSSAEAVAERFPPQLLTVCEGGLADACVRDAAARSALRAVQGPADVQFWNGGALETVSSGTLTAARVTADGMVFLICPKGFDRSALPESWRNPDFLIADSAGGKNDPLRPAAVIYSLDRGTLGKSASAAGSVRAFWTGGYGNLVFELKENRTLKAGREP